MAPAIETARESVAAPDVIAGERSESLPPSTMSFPSKDVYLSIFIYY